MLILMTVFNVFAMPVVVDFKDGTALSAIEKKINAPCQWVHANSADESLAYVNAELSDEQIAFISQIEGVEAVERSVRLTAFTKPNDPLYERQWNLQRIGIESAWEKTKGKGTIVGVLDTGYTHVSDMAKSSVMPGISFIPDEADVTDLNGHGTHIIGTIAQHTDNGIGVAGIAHQSSIVPIKVLDQYGAGQSEWVATGIDEAVDRGAQVINLSLGGDSSKVVQIAIKKAIDKGVIIVAASGNTGREGVASPANIEGVIAVGATGPTDQKSPYSSWGAEVSLTAPGGDKTHKNGGILQNTITKDGDDFLELQGTSMAAPHVTATIALLLSAGAGDAANIKETLFKTAVDLGPDGWDPQYGHGRINAAAALNEVGLERFIRFCTAAAIGGGLAMLAGVPMAIFGFAISGLIAGGFFFFPWLRIEEPTFLMPVLSQSSGGLWHSLFIGSAFIPCIAAIFFLPFLKLRWLAIGIGAAWFTHLAAGAIDGQLPSSSIGGANWYGVNAVIALLGSGFVAAVHFVMGERHAI